jgi:hypothetical protein
MNGTGFQQNLIKQPTLDFNISVSRFNYSRIEERPKEIDSNHGEMKQPKIDPEKQSVTELESHKSGLEVFQYQGEMQGVALESEVAQNIYQKLLNELNSIIQSSLLDRESKERRIDQLLLNLISGITNLSVIDSDSLNQVMLQGLPESLRYEFVTHTRTTEFVQALSKELRVKLQNIILYLKRF